MCLGEETKRFGLPYEKILRGPIPDPFIKGGIHVTCRSRRPSRPGESRRTSKSC